MTRSEQGLGTIRYESRFNRVVEVVLEHTYYNSGLCPDFIFRPSPDTIGLLSQYGLQFRDTGTGFALLRDLGRKQFFWPGQEPLRCSFEGKTSNPLWVNFTDIPLFSALELNFSNAYGPRFLHPGPQADDQVASSADTGGVLLKVVLDFNPEDLGLDSESPIAPFDYRIVFGARATRWRYFCYGREHYSAQFSKFRISSGKEGATFGEARQARLLDGTPGFELVSKTEIALAERPAQRFSLHLDPGISHSGYQGQLPNAGASQVRRRAEAGQFYSDIIFQL